MVGGETGGAWVVRIQGGGLEITLEFSMPGIRAALWNRIDHASKSPTEFGLETARFDLDLLNEVRLKVLADATPQKVGCIHAIDQIDVLRVGRAINLKTIRPVLSGAGQWLLTSARRKRNHGLVRTRLRNRR